MLNGKKIITLVVFYIFATVIRASAMQTVFNVPSADVTEKDHVFVQEEGQFKPWNPDPYYVNTIYTGYGIGHNTELDVNLFNVSSPASENISMGVGFKSVIPIPGLKEKFPEREFKFTVGSNLLVGLEGNGVGNWTYAHLSGRVPKVNTRLTAGVSYGGRQVFGKNNTSFIAAVEQPLTKKVSLLADWFSGDEHFGGYLVVGGSYALPKNMTIYAGYQIPNSPKVGTAGFIVQLAKIF